MNHQIAVRILCVMKEKGNIPVKWQLKGLREEIIYWFRKRLVSSEISLSPYL